MKILLRLSHIIDTCNAFIGRTVMYLVLVAVLVSSINATIRKIFDMSSNAWLELQWNLYGAVFMLAAANTLLVGGHIRIDIFHSRYSRKKQLLVELFGNLIFLLPFCLIMAIHSIPFALHAIELNEQSFNSGGLPTWPAKMLIPAGFILLGLQGISEIIKICATLKGIIPDVTLHKDELEILIPDRGEPK